MEAQKGWTGLESDSLLRADSSLQALLLASIHPS